MNPISTWAAAASRTFGEEPIESIYSAAREDFAFSVHNSGDSLWLLAQWPGGGKVAFRMAYSPAGDLRIDKATEKENGLDLQLSSAIGQFSVELNFPGPGDPLFRYRTTLNPATDLLIPFWPRDIVVPGKDGDAAQTAGKIHASQFGTRSGMVYFSLTRPKAGAVFYLQDLTSLNAYCQQVKASAGDTVGGAWPELGLLLPPAMDQPLKAGEKYIISDAIVQLSPLVPHNEADMVRQYLDLLANAYLQLAKPATTYTAWPDILQKGLSDLIDSPGCWSQVDGNHYFNAYVCDYATPPEIMVQLAVLLPLLDYVEWSDAELAVMKKIKEGLPAFYDEKLGTIVRWHPKVSDTMEGEEEQKQPMVMDSWYLHHPLLNLSRLALKGDAVAKKLFVDSLDYAIKVAKHFDYTWPVFYKIDTLEVVKAETQPGKGGEKDVPGIYAHVMLQAWELTGEKKYLNEAEKAARRLEGLGFELFYQANNTAFSAGALLRLHKITGKQLYLELCYLCMANIFKNVRLWDCNYGYGKNFPSFFALFPLNDAPYTAVYEEQEVFCAFHDFLKHAEDVEILPSVRLLVSEYIRFLVERAVYYYPTMLPKEMLKEKPKIGEVDPNLWIALEDLHDGWEQSGEVGQEVYGAGNAFGILPRHYSQVQGGNFMVYTDYPTYKFASKKKKPFHFKLAGDPRVSCRLMIVKDGQSKLPEITVSFQGLKDPLKGKNVKGGNLEFEVPGDAELTINWK